MPAWRLDPSILIGLLSLAGIYTATVIVPRRASAAQLASFWAGLLTLFVALESPLDTLGDGYLLGMHMIQHLLLVLVVPPLLIYGLPGEALGPFFTIGPIGAVARFLTRGPIAFAIYNVVFALWHLPALFDLTLRNDGVHIVEHLLFIATGVLAWWPILSPVREVPRLSYPFQMLYLFLQTLPCGFVGALITLSGDVLYTPYAAAPRIWGISALSDQQIGGLAMWIGGSVYYFLAFMIVFFIWAARDEPERRLYIVTGPTMSGKGHIP